MAVMTLINIAFTGGVFGAASPWGLAPDLMICFMASIAIMEKSMAGMWLGIINGLILDILFSGALGFYAIPYAVCGSAFYFFSKRFRFMDNFFAPAGMAVIGFVIKDIVLMIVTYLVGIKINAGFIFVRFTLLSALETGLIMLALHILVRWLYRVRALKTLRYDDLKL
jgi:rod shape-determining protein MreD